MYIFITYIYFIYVYIERATERERKQTNFSHVICATVLLWWVSFAPMVGLFCSCGWSLLLLCWVSFAPIVGIFYSCSGSLLLLWWVSFTPMLWWYLLLTFESVWQNSCSSFICMLSLHVSLYVSLHVSSHVSLHVSGRTPVPPSFLHRGT